MTNALYRNSVFFLVLFFLLAILAFFTSYYGILQRPMPYAVHLHGISMTLWCLMLISQSFLIRTKKYRVHRMLGKLSYVLVPFILFSGAHLAHNTISEAQPGSAPYYYMIALMYNALIVFAIFYGFAIWNRKTPAIHARFMVSTVFPLVTPVTDRIIYKYIDGLVPLAPTIEGMPVVPTFGYLLVDLIVIGLLIWDWRCHFSRREKKSRKAPDTLFVFPLVLGVLLLYHLSVLTFWKYVFWQKIGDWIMG
jgi:hypothetical protein